MSRELHWKWTGIPFSLFGMDTASITYGCYLLFGKKILQICSTFIWSNSNLKWNPLILFGTMIRSSILEKRKEIGLKKTKT